MSHKPESDHGLFNRRFDALQNQVDERFRDLESKTDGDFLELARYLDHKFDRLRRQINMGTQEEQAKLDTIVGLISGDEQSLETIIADLKAQAAAGQPLDFTQADAVVAKLSELATPPTDGSGTTPPVDVPPTDGGTGTGTGSGTGDGTPA